MATYRSASNPFIKSNLTTSNTLTTTATSSSNNNNNKPKKEAPGMAKPLVQTKQTNEYHNGVDTSDSSNLMLSFDESTEKQNEKKGNSVDIANIDCCNKEIKIQNHKVKNEDKLNHEEAAIHASTPCCSVSFESDVISATLKNLTDEVVRSELQESKTELENNTEQISSEKSNCSMKHNTVRVAQAGYSYNNLDNEEQEDEEDVLENDPAPMEQDTRQHQHIELIKKLRLQLRDLEKYAYERGQLDEVPPSILAERQSVILNSIKSRLSLSIEVDELDKLELDELKKQVDKEIHNVMDPLITKEHLLNQLKTQLSDLERYISHLHGTIGKIHDKNTCSCQLHGCSSSPTTNDEFSDNHEANNLHQLQHSTSGFFKSSSLTSNDVQTKTSRLIRNLVTQLICTDIKLQERVKKEKACEDQFSQNHDIDSWSTKEVKAVLKVPKFHDDAAWTLHIDKVILATDSLVNLFTLEPQYQKSSESRHIDESLVESVVRRQLIPAIRDLLSYGLIDLNSLPRSTSYASLLFNPYYLLSTLTCFPSFQNSQHGSNNEKKSVTHDKYHVWTVIQDYYESRNEPQFKSSSVKTLSQSFNLGATNNGPIKITSKQAFLIAVEDIIETLAKCKPNGPESHFREFIYTGLNRRKLSTWLRLVFKNKSVIRRYYHNFSFVCMPDKMDKFLTTLDLINQFEFKLKSDVESIEQYVNAF